MDVRDITNELTLLKSYKTVFVDNQKYELIKAYADHGDSFPVFTERVFTASTKSPVALIDYKLRKDLEKSQVGRIFILERTDNPSDITKTRLFWVWLSPKLVARWSKGGSDSVTASTSVLFHPFGNLNNYPAYWQGSIDPPKLPDNYLELGARYHCKEKDTVAQHLCALRPAGAPGQNSGLEDKDSKLDLMVVVPVSSPSAFNSLSNGAELEGALREIARRCYEGVSGSLLRAGPPSLTRVAVAGYSRSGAILQSMFANTRSNDSFFRDRIKEVYAFDVMLDEFQIDKETKVKTVIKTKQQGYDTLWANLKAWQGDDSDKRIRLYSAEPATVSNVYTELKNRLQKFGGGYHNPSVKFSAFNGARMPTGSANYASLTDGYEIYSTDNSRSLAVLPSGNPLVYLSSENIKNPNGFPPGGDYSPNLEGHSWFVSRLFSHALFHSGF
jgi:hypothetical protein